MKRAGESAVDVSSMYVIAINRASMLRNGCNDGFDGDDDDDQHDGMRCARLAHATNADEHYVFCALAFGQIFGNGSSVMRAACACVESGTHRDGESTGACSCVSTCFGCDVRAGSGVCALPLHSW